MASVRVRVVVAWVVVATLLSGVVPGAGGPVVQEQPDTDTTATRVTLTADGDGRWAVRVRTRLATETDVEAFRSFQRAFRNNTSRYLDPFRDRIRNVVAGAGDETDRSMRARNFSASTSIQEVPRRWGVVTYEFTWTNFARTDEDALVVGDVFAGGFFLAANDSFTLEGPPGYRVATVDPTPDDSGDGAVTWSGRRDFTDRRPFARFEPAPDDSPTGSRTPTDTGSPTGTDPAAGLGAVSRFAALGLVGVLLAGVLFGLYRYRRDDADRGVVTDEDRVRDLLEEHGGQMKQAAIADAFDWSASKTSRLLSRMEEEGTVEKLRIGRENVIRLAEED